MTRSTNNLHVRVNAPEKRPEGKRVLCYSEAWGKGGIETFLMELFRHHQAMNFAFTLFSCWDWNTAFDGELDSLGIDRYTVFPDHKPAQVKRLKEGSNGFAHLIERIKPDAVYVNTMNGMGFLYAKVAKRMGVPSRIVHSHNSAFGSGNAAVKAAMHSFGKAALGKNATVRVACSADAGNYLFGNHPYTIVNNGIDTDHFAYSPSAGGKLRQQFDIPQEALLFGNVGRIAEAKNPLFQVRTFAEIFLLNPSAYYLMVGDGEMRPQVEALVEELSLKDRVITVGHLSDPSAAYSALDCLLMPSVFEGLGTVRVEAQCSGCPVLCSEGLPAEAHITDAEAFLPLSAGEEAWAKKALEMANVNRERKEYASLVRKAGFDVNDTTRQVVSILQSS